MLRVRWSSCCCCCSIRSGGNHMWCVTAGRGGALPFSPRVPILGDVISNSACRTHGGGGTVRLLLPPTPLPPNRAPLLPHPLSSSRCRSRSVSGGEVVAAVEEGGRDDVGGGGGSVRSPDLVDREYADLNLKEKLGGQLGHVRIRQHVNPLSTSLSIPVQVPDWNQVFRDSALPLMVDIGSGSGRFLIWLAKKSPESKNYLGLEIRQKLVKRAQFWVKDLALTNIYFMFANATVSFEQLVATYPGPLMLVSILCPDPHFKKRHHKRRVVQKPLVNSISRNLSPGGQVFLQSDVLEVALDMRNQFDDLSDVFEHADGLNPDNLCDAEGWLLSNPMGIRTEREIHAELGGARIYRRIYRKRAHLSSVS